MSDLLVPDHNVEETLASFRANNNSNHAPRILMLYGSLRAESYSKKATEEAARVLESFGAEVKIYDPTGLPVFDREDYQHEKVQELHKLALWSEGMVWCSPEIHGNLTSVIKNQIDWIPLSLGAVRPTQGRTLAVMR
jgi:arsenic resistance protein ArsH